MKPQLETVEFGSRSFMRSLHCVCKNFQDDHGWHYHPEFELAYVFQGHGTRFIGDSVEAFQSGELLLLGPNIPHCWVSQESCSHSDMRVLQFSTDTLGSAFWKLPEFNALSQWLHSARKGVVFNGFSAEQLMTRMNAISENQGAGRVALFIELLEWLRSIPLQHSIIGDLYQLDSEQFQGARMNKAISYVRKNLGEDIRQSDVANLVGMTTHSFSRFFKASSGRTFVSFVNQLRVSEVCRQLEFTSDDIADIAFRCGFGNLSNFNRRFFDIKNTTPRAYRQALMARRGEALETRLG